MIRVKAVMLIEHDGRFLFEESQDRVKEETFYMPFGGGVEFDESSQEAVIREVKEELNIDAAQPDLLGVVENRFWFEGKPGHDVVFIYHTMLPQDFDPTSITPEIFNGKALIPVWLTEQEIVQSSSPFYPEGIIEMVTALYEIPY
jgi:8-oxo-dGTP pyrophosphatase MutT (NUDIX family)